MAFGVGEPSIHLSTMLILCDTIVLGIWEGYPDIRAPYIVLFNCADGQMVFCRRFAFFSLAATYPDNVISGYPDIQISGYPENSGYPGASYLDV